MKTEPLVLFEVRTPGLKRREVEEFAHALRDEVAGGRPFCCLMTTDDELRRMNREFLGKDYATDVLSFPSGDGAGGLGDIAISWQRAREQGEAEGHGTAAEVRVLLLHGVLHLMGYDHETDRGRMKRVEVKWRKRFGLAGGLIERVGR